MQDNELTLIGGWENAINCGVAVLGLPGLELYSSGVAKIDRVGPPENVRQLCSKARGIYFELSASQMTATSNTQVDFNNPTAIQSLKRNCFSPFHIFRQGYQDGAQMNTITKLEVVTPISYRNSDGYNPVNCTEQLNQPERFDNGSCFEMQSSPDVRSIALLVMNGTPLPAPMLIEVAETCRQYRLFAINLADFHPLRFPDSPGSRSLMLHHALAIQLRWDFAIVNDISELRTAIAPLLLHNVSQSLTVDESATATQANPKRYKSGCHFWKQLSDLIDNEDCNAFCSRRSYYNNEIGGEFVKVFKPRVLKPGKDHSRAEGPYLSESCVGMLAFVYNKLDRVALGFPGLSNMSALLRKCSSHGSESYQSDLEHAANILEDIRSHREGGIGRVHFTQFIVWLWLMGSVSFAVAAGVFNWGRREAVFERVLDSFSVTTLLLIAFTIHQLTTNDANASFEALRGRKILRDFRDFKNYYDRRLLKDICFSMLRKLMFGSRATEHVGIVSAMAYARGRLKWHVDDSAKWWFLASRPKGSIECTVNPHGSNLYEAGILTGDGIAVDFHKHRAFALDSDGGAAMKAKGLLHHTDLTGNTIYKVGEITIQRDIYDRDFPPELVSMNEPTRPQFSRPAPEYGC